MTVSAATLRKLAALRLDPDQMAGVLEMLADQQEADEKRKSGQRERTRKSRGLQSSNVTVTSPSQYCNTPPTSPLFPPDKESSPTPPKENNPPIIPHPPVSVLSAAAQKRKDNEEWFDTAVRYDYPRKTPRLPALKAWMRLTDAERLSCAVGVTDYSIQFDELVAKSKRSRDEEMQFVPHLATWINQRRWENVNETSNG